MKKIIVLVSLCLVGIGYAFVQVSSIEYEELSPEMTSEIYGMSVCGTCSDANQHMCPIEGIPECEGTEFSECDKCNTPVCRDMNVWRKVCLEDLTSLTSCEDNHNNTGDEGVCALRKYPAIINDMCTRTWAHPNGIVMFRNCGSHCNVE